MAGVRTRKQAALTSQPSTPVPASKPIKVQPIINENGVSESAKPKLAAADYPYENIFLFYPNIIGYSRIVLAVASLYYMPYHPRTCCILYSISCLLDALDGYAARYFEQSTRFGAVLDMVTDRCTTACLLVFLSSAFPRWSLVFQGLISLDLASHYMHMYASLVMGDSDSHKKVDEGRSWLLHLYYTNKTVLFLFCLFNETFFIALYLLSFSSLLSPSILGAGTENGGSLQDGIAVTPVSASSIFTDPYSAGALELARANKLDDFWPFMIAIISCPVMVGKQILNGIQLVKAARWLGEGDRAARRKAGLPRPKLAAAR